MEDTVESLGPWFYDFDFGVHGRTQSRLPGEMQSIHSTRLQMVNNVLDAYIAPGREKELSCIDIACHEGFYLLETGKRGIGRMVGVDIREQSLRKARFAAKALGLNRAEFLEMNAEELSPELVGRFDITLFLGLLYHVENPMLCLRRAASVTTGVCIVETQVIDEVEGTAEWGQQHNLKQYQGVLALIDEASDFHGGNNEMGATPLATCPSRRGLVTMLKHAEFVRVEFVAAPADGYEQLVRGKRVVCAAFKP